MKMLQELLLMLIHGILTIVIPILLFQLRKKLSIWIKDSRYRAAIDKIATVCSLAVVDVAQTYTKRVRKSGQWSGDAANEAKALAVQKVKDILGPNGIANLASATESTNIEALISSSVESAYVQAKSNVAANPTRITSA